MDYVLILILLEDGFCFNKKVIVDPKWVIVLILILLEDGFCYLKILFVNFLTYLS